jgi:hypothetical protein
MKSPVFFCSRVKTIQDRSCSDCVTVEMRKNENLVEVANEFQVFEGYKYIIRL